MSKFPTYTLRLADRLLTVDRPQVMGIINATPDSFFAGSRTPGAEAIVSRVERMMAEGVDIIDCGAYSSRPGAADVSEAEEM
ncbi:MAG: dihydropteroate synthase, partial [Paramuribaculum sp.]|nr:dihydropteroate synthase [Paramuribaculum sp.]